MAHAIEGNETIGYRVIDEERGALTGRKKTPEDALAVAGLEPEQKPRGRAAKKTDDDSSDES